MDTVRYLSVCLNTLNLPFVLQNESHEVTKYFKKLSTIPTSMLMSDGVSLQTHLELMAEANPAQKYLLTKQGYSFDNFKAEVLKFQKSKGYSDLMYEYKAVGTETNRPHHFLQATKLETPSPQPVSNPPQMPEQLVEAPIETPSTTPSQPATATTTETPSQDQTSPIKKAYYKESPTPELNKEATAKIPEKPLEPTTPPPQSPPLRSRMMPPTVAAIPPSMSTLKQPLPQPPQQAIPSGAGQGQVKPSRVIPPMRIPPLNVPQPVRNTSLNLGSQTGRIIQRASRITIPTLVGGFLKTTGMGLLGTIPGLSSSANRAPRGVSFLRGGGGGGGRGFISRVLPLPNGGGGRSWLVILLILLGFLVMFMFFFGNPIDQLSNTTDIKNIEITKSAPQAVDNGSRITYNILVRNKGTKNAQVVISDDIPQNTSYESGNNDPVASDSGKTVRNIRWTLNSLVGGAIQNLTFTVVPTKEDTWIINQAKGTVAIGVSGGNVQIPGNIAPNQNNCNGKWTFKTPLGNYGDPTCNFSKDDLYTLLKQLDPVDADYWFYTVARCESAYDPNNFLGASASGLGAYGLYQMNPSGKGNGQYDAGDVIWQLQSSNAVNYNNQLSKKWRYWACAQDRW